MVKVVIRLRVPISAAQVMRGAGLDRAQVRYRLPGRAARRVRRARPTSSSRTARWRCGRSGSRSSTIAGSSIGCPSKPPADQLRQVIVADGQRVGVAEGALSRLGGGPFARHRAATSSPHAPAPAGVRPAARASPRVARSRRRCGPGRGRRWRGGTPTTGCAATPRPTAAPACGPVQALARASRTSSPARATRGGRPCRTRAVRGRQGSAPPAPGRCGRAADAVRVDARRRWSVRRVRNPMRRHRIRVARAAFR